MRALSHIGAAGVEPAAFHPSTIWAPIAAVPGFADVRLDVNAIDYAILGVYLLVVLGVGWVAMRYVKTSLE
jgi:hypothetical protein